jgi:hypothetical protein
MSRLNIVPDMTHDFLLALSRGEGLSQVRYFSGDFFFVYFIIFPGISSLFLLLVLFLIRFFPIVPVTTLLGADRSLGYFGKLF